MCDKIVTDPIAASVLREMHELFKPGTFDWDFNLPGMVIAENDYSDALEIVDGNLVGLDIGFYPLQKINGRLWIHGLKHLKTIKIYNTGYSPLSRPSLVVSLEGLPVLEELDLQNVEIYWDFSLAMFKRLKKLSVTLSGMHDIKFLETMTQLTHLDLTANEIIDIDCLRGLTRLVELKLGNNNIRDIGPLATLIKLSNLELFGNEVDDISPLASLPALATLDNEKIKSLKSNSD